MDFLAAPAVCHCGKGRRLAPPRLRSARSVRLFHRFLLTVNAARCPLPVGTPAQAWNRCPPEHRNTPPRCGGCIGAYCPRLPRPPLRVGSASSATAGCVGGAGGRVALLLAPARWVGSRHRKDRGRFARPSASYGSRLAAVTVQSGRLFLYYTILPTSTKRYATDIQHPDRSKRQGGAGNLWQLPQRRAE